MLATHSKLTLQVLFRVDSKQQPLIMFRQLANKLSKLGAPWSRSPTGLVKAISQHNIKTSEVTSSTEMQKLRQMGVVSSSTSALKLLSGAAFKKLAVALGWPATTVSRLDANLKQMISMYPSSAAATLQEVG
jgi:hypothetical protein